MGKAPFLLHFSDMMIVTGVYSAVLSQIEDTLLITQVAVVDARSCCCVCCMCLCCLFVNIVRFQVDVNLRAAMFVSECYMFVGLSVCMCVVAFAPPLPASAETKKAG